jgi:CheY-like chemotaxis protein
MSARPSDDNRDAAASLVMLLETMGADVRVAHDGAQGLTEFQQFRPLMVLLDIGMPGMDGYSPADAARATARLHRGSHGLGTGWRPQARA